MGSWQVFYESWQMECCGTPFSVGDEVTWPLRFTDADESLAVELHGGKWPERTGLVQEIRLVSERNAAAVPGSSTREPVPGERSLRTVDTCPKWFNTDESRTPEGLAETGVLVTLAIPDATPPQPRDRR
ncbi:DUF6578 domain-containing protein [Streptomyces sp. NPDC050704]|uniref:DUF6578 domain-containing protein n=1 Tax=Streptomyces sp. NPDC050704 TaxID=3157219 RepID=UPI00341521DD